MRLEVPKELLWAIIASLSVALIAVIQAPYQGHYVPSHQKPADRIGSQQTPNTAPPSLEKPARDQQKTKSAEHAPEVTILGVKPGEWLLGIVTFLLWYATNRLVRQSKDDTRILQRAYLSVAPGGMSRFISDRKLMACDVVILNAGNLPASNITWFIDRKFSVDPIDKDFPIKTGEGDIVIAPRVQIIKGSAPVDADDVINFNPNGGQRDRWLYVWGRITYLDGFKTRRFYRLLPSLQFEHSARRSPN